MHILELLLNIISINLHYVFTTHYLLCYFLLFIAKFIIIIIIRIYINKFFRLILQYSTYGQIFYEDIGGGDTIIYIIYKIIQNTLDN